LKKITLLIIDYTAIKSDKSIICNDGGERGRALEKDT
jgi:hypothetical protein